MTEPRKRRSPCARFEDEIRDLRERLAAIVAMTNEGDRNGWHKQRSDALRAIAKGSDE